MVWSPIYRRGIAAFVVAVFLANFTLVNHALARQGRSRLARSVTSFQKSRGDSPYLDAGFGLAQLEKLDDLAPKASSDSQAPVQKRGLWGRFKRYMAEDWRQTKEDMRAVGNWLATPFRKIRFGWRRFRERLRRFRTRLFHGGALFAITVFGKELNEEERRTHLLVTAIIEAGEYESLIRALETSNQDELEQLALECRKIEDPVLQQQLLQRYVSRRYLRMRDEMKNQDPAKVFAVMEELEERAANLEVSDPDPNDWVRKDEKSPAKVYAPYYPWTKKKGKRGVSLPKLLMTLVSAGGLIIAGYFAFVSPGLLPIMAFIGALISFFAFLRKPQFGEQFIVSENPPPGTVDYPEMPEITEPPPLVEFPDDDDTGGSDPGQDPGGSDPGDDPGGSWPPPGAKAEAQEPLLLTEAMRVKPRKKQAPLVLTEEMRIHETPEQLETIRVNLNTAKGEELQRLPGVGPTTAKRILAARRKAKFKDPHELLRIPGIGPKKLEVMAPHIEL